MTLLDLVRRFLVRRAGGGLSLLHQRRHRGVPDLPAREERWALPLGSAPWAEDPHWFPGGTAPSLCNEVTPLIDGEQYFPELCRSLQAAQHYVFIAGWFLTPRLPLLRQTEDDLRQTQLLQVLQVVSGRVPVRVLLWGGAAILFRPTTRMARETQRAFAEASGGDLRCRLDFSARPSHCHHQKAVVIDGQVAFVGGLDFTTLEGDRWDSTEHPLRLGINWHDVQLRLRGEAVAAVERNFRQRWTAVSRDEPLPHREPETNDSWSTPVQIVRTIPVGTYPFAPKGEFGIHHAYLELIRRARRFIYLENQYLWDPVLLEELIAALRRPRAEPFRIVLVLPAQAEDGKWDNDRHVSRLRAADEGRGNVSIYCLYTSGPSAGPTAFAYRPVYVHAKVAIADDEWATVGSANLNHRGLRTDSEINALVHDPALARHLRATLWSHHLALPEEEVARADPVEVIDRLWSSRAKENADTIAHRDGPLRGAVHPYELGHMPGSWLLQEVEVLTFDR